MLRIAILSAAVLAASAAPALAADITGRWRTPTNGEIEIYRCGAAFCGRLLHTPRFSAEPNLTDQNNKDAAMRGRKLKGLTLLEGFSGGPTEWKGGRLYNPEDGNTYTGTITVQDANTLKLKGCVVAPLCKTQVWKRM